MNQTTSAEKSFNKLSFILLGVVFWFSGVLFIHFAGEMLFVSGSPWLVMLFVTAIPASWCFVKITAMVGRVNGEALLGAVSLASIAAAIADGIALTWFPSWYGLKLPSLMLAAAWLIFTFGSGLGIAYWISSRVPENE